MTLRNTSGKFSLPSFGRKASGAGGPDSPNRHNGHYSDDAQSPARDGHHLTSGFGNGGGGGGGGGGSGGAAFDGLGRKLGKTIAHQSFLPGLGNKDLRALQDLISAEKGVLTMTERLGVETQKAAASLPTYGAQEGPDLQDVLTQSSTLLSQLGSALSVFVDHSANLRSCYKKIREREESLDELRRRRRATGAKAETAEKKLAKMGPENKGLPSQTELLEKLRGDMRQMDTDIVNEESKLGDFKRQMVKEALSFKFGGLEELGEKMCIIGELGKLLLEEIPLEETPPGYGRAPYMGFDKTENAVNEATKCLSTVKFSAASANPKPPGLPPHDPARPLLTPQLPHPHDVSAAEEFAHYPGGADAASPPTKGKGRDYSLHESNPYGGLSNPYDNQNIYGEYGGVRPTGENPNRHIVWQGPTEDDSQGRDADKSQEYEYEQQRQLDAEEQAWRESQGHPAPNHSDLPHQNTPPQPEVENQTPPTTTDQNGLHVPWQPLNVKRDRSATPEPISLRDESAPAAVSHGFQSHPPHLETPDLGEHIRAGVPHQGSYVTSPMSAHPDDLLPPPSIGQIGPATPGERDMGFYTPRESNTPEPQQVNSIPPPPEPVRLPSPIPPPNPQQTYNVTPGVGKISAAAFRRGAKRSTDPEDIAGGVGNSPESSSVHRIPRKLPQPPGPAGPLTPSTSGNVLAQDGGPQTPLEANFELPASPTGEYQPRLGDEVEGRVPNSPPPGYHAESLR